MTTTAKKPKPKTTKKLAKPAGVTRPMHSFCLSPTEYAAIKVIARDQGRSLSSTAGRLFIAELQRLLDRGMPDKEAMSVARRAGLVRS